MLKLEHNKGVFIEDMYYDKEDINNLKRLQTQLFKEENIIATIEECANIWQTYSGDLCASFLFFPDDDNCILSNIKSSRNFTSFEEYSK